MAGVHDDDAYARAWGLPGVLGYFEKHRRATSDVYPSEWIFLEKLLRNGISILDVGCAIGGFANIAAEHVSELSYTGIDVSREMVARARELHPQHEFHEVDATDFSVLGGRRFDLVLCLGILHLNDRWIDLLAESWRHTKDALLFDLRETDGPTITDRSRSFFRMDFNADDPARTATVLPYNVINTAEALRATSELAGPDARVTRYGYLHDVRNTAVTPYAKVMMTTYCVTGASAK